MNFRFLFFFFHFFIQAKTSSNTLDNEVKEVSYNKYYKEEITGQTVNEYKFDRIIFNVFKDIDYEIYTQLLN